VVVILRGPGLEPLGVVYWTIGVADTPVNDSMTADVCPVRLTDNVWELPVAPEGTTR
jgi:hypothetical protein